jgi:ribosome-binding ATPase YchF (GTP1/OBG family)
MRVGLAGFAGTGKSTVFRWLTGVVPDAARALQGQVGLARIPDPRLDWLAAHFRPRKVTPASLEFLDVPGLALQERRDNPRRLALLRDTGGLLVVLAGFSGNDPVLQLRRFREELILADLEIVSNRCQRLQEQLKKPRPAKQKEADEEELVLLQRLHAVLEQGQAAAQLGLTPEEEKKIRSFQLLTLKPHVVFVNQGEEQLAQPLPAELVSLAGHLLHAPVRLLLEMDELPPQERQAFLEDYLGQAASRGMSREEILRSIYYSMGQIVFFTVGEDECRAWGVPRGTTAVEGAAEIHTDLARGFVRGEVVPFDDFRRCGSFKEARAQGVYRLEGKNYVLQDGDIFHVLAST